MEVNELRQKSEKELSGLLKELERELKELKIEHRVEGLLDTSELGKKKKDIARLKTVLKEKEILTQIE